MMKTQFNESVTRVLAEMNFDSLEQANQPTEAHNVDQKALVMDGLRLFLLAFPESAADRFTPWQATRTIS